MGRAAVVSLFAELKRRNVFRVGIAYVIVAWLVLQVADVVLNNITAPDWVFQVIMLVLAIGLPVVLVFAWAFELTPEGIMKEKDIDRSQSISNTTGRKLDRAIIIVLVIALVYFIWERPARGPVPIQEPMVAVVLEETATALDKSIAVLPFVNMSADADNEYFSDGLSEELLNLLAKVDGLKVAARTSSFKFKNSEADIADIGKQLNVATVLEGSVRKAGNDVRITAQLIKVDDGFHLWSETYDRSLDNIFEVQGEIAGHIVDALKLPLLGQDAQPVTLTATASVEAYDLFLLGRNYTRSKSEANLEKSIDYFSQATELDPGFAPAWGGLAEAYLWLSDFGGMSTQTAIDLAKKAIDKALELDPTEPVALAAEAFRLNLQGRETASSALLQQILRINPNHIDALLRLSNWMSGFDFEGAGQLARKAFELDPLDERTRRGYIHRLNAEDRLEEAESQLRQYIREEPENPMYHEIWGQVLWTRGQYEKAIIKYEIAHELRPGDSFPAHAISAFYLYLDDAESARKWMEIAAERAPNARWPRLAQYRLYWHEEDWESLDSAYAEAMRYSPANTRENPEFMYFVGNLTLRLGDREKAETIYRGALADMGYEPPRITSDEMAELTASLANVLPDGAEREDLIAALASYQAYLEEYYGWRQFPYRVKAWLATFDDDRDGALAALSKAIDHNLTYSKSVELDLILARWKDDPMFQEQVLRMRQIAQTRRAELEAGP
jgi:TolB-like protein/cytochrome c-type biogenesis protein CcmH/NrfG